MQRHKDVKYRAGSGTYTQEGLLGCGQGVGCCTGDKAESVSRSQLGAPCGLCPPPKTIRCAPHLFRPNLIFTKWLQALTSSQVLGLSPGCEETRSGPTGLPWPFRERQHPPSPPPPHRPSPVGASAAPSGLGLCSPPCSQNTRLPWPGGPALGMGNPHPARSEEGCPLRGGVCAESCWQGADLGCPGFAERTCGRCMDVRVVKSRAAAGGQVCAGGHGRCRCQGVWGRVWTGSGVWIQRTGLAKRSIKNA